MFKDEYQKAMSFPVSEELLERTARGMKSAASRRKASASPYSKFAAAAAAVFLLAFGLAGGRLSMSGGNTSGAPAGYSVQIENDTAENGMMTEGAMAADAGAPPRDTAPAAGGESSTETAALLKSAPSAASIAVSHKLEGVEEESAFLSRSAAEGMDSANPWTETVAALPIYENSALAGEGLLDGEELQSNARRIAETLYGKADLAEYVILDEDAGSYTFGDVSIENTGEVTAAFPSGTAVKQAGSAEAAAAAFYGDYAELFPLAKPAYSVSLRYGDDGSPIYTAVVYDAAGTEEDQIYAYNFAGVRFEMTPGDDTYQLDLLRFRLKQPETADGWFPLLSLEEAKACLLSGEYQSGEGLTAPTDETAVLGAELVYWTAPAAVYWQPVYRFLAEQPVKSASGFGVYAYFYVPACTAE